MLEPLQEILKEVVGIHALLTRSLFGADILRGWLQRVSLAKPTSAPLRCGWLRRTKPQFGSRQHQWPRETRRAAGAVRHSTTVLQIFRPVLRPPVWPQETRRHDPLGARLRPLMSRNRGRSTSIRLPASQLFRPRSTRGLLL